MLTNPTNVWADEPTINCVDLVREQRDLAAEAGVSMSRSEQTTLLDQCNSGALQRRIAEQEQILADFKTEIAQLNLRFDANNQIIDENNQIIAFIVKIDGQLVIQRQLDSEITALRIRQAAMLAEADRILQRLVTQ